MPRPKIGLALGSGGARGFAHLGVIKALQEAGIPIDLIAGSSMGAMIACFYGAGLNIESLCKFSCAFKRKYYLDFAVPKMGLITGKRVKDLVRVFTHGKRIEELEIPIGIVATDLKSGEKVVFKKGPIAEAVRASISIPGIFVPEQLNGRLYIDGGVVDRVPVSVAKEMGADLIIAVDVANAINKSEVTSIYDVIMQSIDIMQMELFNHRTLASDVMIRPPVDKYSSRAFTNTEEIIAAGEEATREHINKIEQLIEHWKGT